MHKSIDLILPALMRAKGIKSVSELARLAGVGQPTLQRIIKKKILSPTDEQVKKLADYFSLTTDQIRGYQPIPADVFMMMPETDSIMLSDVKPPKYGQVSSQTEFEALLNLSTPRTRVELVKIAQAAADGKLTDADIILLKQIADRLAAKE